MGDPSKEVWIDYTNYRGERAWRRILPLSLSFKSSQRHPETQWIMEAVDCDKDAVRDFALASIHEWSASGRAEQASEIESLRAREKVLVEALEPFLQYHFAGMRNDGFIEVLVKHLRGVHAALTPLPVRPPATR